MNLRSAKTVTLFEHGQIHKEAGAKLGRLSVTANCSLVIQKVTDQDVGQYKCRRFISGYQQDSPVHLSVIHSEYLYISVVKLMCLVLSNILKYYINTDYNDEANVSVVVFISRYLLITSD